MGPGRRQEIAGAINTFRSQATPPLLASLLSKMSLNNTTTVSKWTSADDNPALDTTYLVSTVFYVLPSSEAWSGAIIWHWKGSIMLNNNLTPAIFT